MDDFEVLLAAATPEMTRRLIEPLRLAGYHVATEPDAEGAARHLAAGGVDVVVLDLHLPGLSVEALREVLSRESLEIPVEPLELVERRHILSALRHTGGNKRRAALLLGIARSTLIQKVRKLGTDSPQEP